MEGSCFQRFPSGEYAHQEDRGWIGSVWVGAPGDEGAGLSASCIPHEVPGFTWLHVTSGSEDLFFPYPISVVAAGRALERAGLGEGSRWMAVPMKYATVCPFLRRDDEPRKEPPSVVYFLQAGAGGPIKIGTSNDLTRRLAQLQSGCPETLVVIGVIPGDGAVEDEWHARFEHLRVRGEWFSAEADLTDAIEEVTRVAH